MKQKQINKLPLNHKGSHDIRRHSESSDSHHGQPFFSFLPLKRAAAQAPVWHRDSKYAKWALDPQWVASLTSLVQSHCECVSPPHTKQICFWLRVQTLAVFLFQLFQLSNFTYWSPVSDAPPVRRRAISGTTGLTGRRASRNSGAFCLIRATLISKLTENISML